MDSIIAYVLEHGVVLTFNSSSIGTWIAIAYLARIVAKINNNVSEIKEKLIETTTEMKMLSKNQQQMHDDNVSMFKRGK